MTKHPSDKKLSLPQKRRKDTYFIGNKRIKVVKIYILSEKESFPAFASELLSGMKNMVSRLDRTKGTKTIINSFTSI